VPSAGKRERDGGSKRRREHDLPFSKAGDEQHDVVEMWRTQGLHHTNDAKVGPDEGLVSDKSFDDSEKKRANIVASPKPNARCNPKPRILTAADFTRLIILNLRGLLLRRGHCPLHLSRRRSSENIFHLLR